MEEVWKHVQDLDPVENDILLMGDFNKNKPTHRAFKPLREGLGLRHLIVGDGVFTSYSNKADKIGANWYDHMWVDPTFTNHEFTGNSGVDLLHERYFTDDPPAHLKVRTKISDHLPIWAEFNVSQPDDD